MENCKTRCAESKLSTICSSACSVRATGEEILPVKDHLHTNCKTHLFDASKIHNSKGGRICVCGSMTDNAASMSSRSHYTEPSAMIEEGIICYAHSQKQNNVRETAKKQTGNDAKIRTKKGTIKAESKVANLVGGLMRQVLSKSTELTGIRTPLLKQPQGSNRRQQSTNPAISPAQTIVRSPPNV